MNISISSARMNSSISTRRCENVSRFTFYVLRSCSRLVGAVNDSYLTQNVKRKT
jgi:hypothetical protein